MIQASGWEDTATDESKVFVHIAKISGDDLKMADWERFVFEDVKVKETHIYVSHVSFLAV
jgi:hypothetical protein